jgi:hypothetical protein
MPDRGNLNFETKYLSKCHFSKRNPTWTALGLRKGTLTVKLQQVIARVNKNTMRYIVLEL